jgi:transmembrane sensor
MTVVLPTPDASVVTRLVGGDQGALITLYRQSYDALLSAAGEALGPELAHFRGRVAENAMRNVWQERARFANPVAVTAYLEEAVRQEAEIQRRKHASLKRRDGQTSSHITVPGVDEAVQKLEAALAGPAVDHDTLLAEAREVKKAHAREHVQRVGGRPKWIVPTILGVLAVVAIIGLQQYLDKAGVDAAIDRTLKGENVQTLSSGKGQRGSLTLRDGTKAAIGSDSKLRIPEEFATAKMRTIALEGTATFTVAAGTGPEPVDFSVRSGSATFTAKSGLFTVRHYEEDSALYLEVKEGTVTVKDRESGTTQDVAAGSALKIVGSAMSPLEGVAKDVALAWTRDSLVFDNQPLKVVVPELVRWFSLNAAIADPSVENRPVSMRIALSSSGDATKALTAAANLAIQFGKDDRIEFNAAAEGGAKK